MKDTIPIEKIIIDQHYHSLVQRMSKEDDITFDESIKEEGIRDPVTLNQKMIMLDGHSRYEKAVKYFGLFTNEIKTIKEKIDNQEKAIKENEIENKKELLQNELKEFKTRIAFLIEHVKLFESVPYRIKHFDDPLLEEKYVIECNLQRRHLTNFQKVELGLLLLDIEKKLAKQRKLATLKQNRTETDEPINETKGKALDIIARKVGVSSSVMMRGKKIADEAPEHLKEKVRAGKTSINSVYNHITRAERNLPKVILPDGKWSVVHVDLPIEFDDKGVRGSATNNYDTIPLSELKVGVFNGKDVRDCFADNCVIFAWFQASTIFYAKDILESWGFKCITNQVWDKEIIGTGSWLANRHEHLVIAVKGHMPLPAERLESLVRYRRNTNDVHSKKPVVFYGEIEIMYPNWTYLDLFSRYKHNESWTCFGNEVKE